MCRNVPKIVPKVLKKRIFKKVQKLRKSADFYMCHLPLNEILGEIFYCRQIYGHFSIVLYCGHFVSNFFISGISRGSPRVTCPHCYSSTRLRDILEL